MHKHAIRANVFFLASVLLINNGNARVAASGLPCFVLDMTSSVATSTCWSSSSDSEFERRRRLFHGEATAQDPKNSLPLRTPPPSQQPFAESIRPPQMQQQQQLPSTEIIRPLQVQQQQQQPSSAESIRPPQLQRDVLPISTPSVHVPQPILECAPSTVHIPISESKRSTTQAQPQPQQHGGLQEVKVEKPTPRAAVLCSRLAPDRVDEMTQIVQQFKPSHSLLWTRLQQPIDPVLWQQTCLQLEKRQVPRSVLQLLQHGLNAHGMLFDQSMLVPAAENLNWAQVIHWLTQTLSAEDDSLIRALQDASTLTYNTFALVSVFAGNASDESQQVEERKEFKE